MVKKTSPVWRRREEILAPFLNRGIARLPGGEAGDSSGKLSINLKNSKWPQNLEVIS